MTVKIIFVISEGPMGASVVAGLIETFGFLQLPFRAYDLIDHANQRTDPNRSFFRALRSWTENHSKPVNQGITVAEDRQVFAPFRRFDPESLGFELERLQRDIDQLSVQEFYDHSRRAVAKSITYKSVPENLQGHVELVTVIRDSVDKTRLQKFKESFPDLHLICMERDFVDWCESLAAARFLSPSKWRNFLFSDLVFRYSRYSAAVASLGSDALNVEFNEVFQPHTSNVVEKLCDFVGEKKPSKEAIEKGILDLFGQPIPFLKATTLGDTPGRYFSDFSRAIIRSLKPQGHPGTWLHRRTPRWKSIIVFLCYFFEFVRYHIRRKLRWK